jgi:hypothetical protein
VLAFHAFAPDDRWHVVTGHDAGSASHAGEPPPLRQPWLGSRAVCCVPGFGRRLAVHVSLAGRYNHWRTLGQSVPAAEAGPFGRGRYQPQPLSGPNWRRRANQHTQTTLHNPAQTAQTTITLGSFNVNSADKRSPSCRPLLTLMHAGGSTYLCREHMSLNAEADRLHTHTWHGCHSGKAWGSGFLNCFRSAYSSIPASRTATPCRVREKASTRQTILYISSSRPTQVKLKFHCKRAWLRTAASPLSTRQAVLKLHRMRLPHDAPERCGRDGSGLLEM